MDHFSTAFAANKIRHDHPHKYWRRKISAIDIGCNQPTRSIHCLSSTFIRMHRRIVVKNVNASNYVQANYVRRKHWSKGKIGARRNHNLIMHQFLATRLTKCISCNAIKNGDRSSRVSSSARRKKKYASRERLELNAQLHMLSPIWSDRKCLDFVFFLSSSSLASPTQLYALLYIYCACGWSKHTNTQTHTSTHSRSNGDHLLNSIRD